LGLKWLGTAHGLTFQGAPRDLGFSYCSIALRGFSFSSGTYATDSKIPETPKSGAAVFSNCFNVIAGTNLLALQGAAAEAKRLGCQPFILTSHLADEAREVARVRAAVANDVTSWGLPCQPPACLLAGGETTVTVRGNAKGGRNQEMALSFLWEIEKEPNLLSDAYFLSFSTDGEDGPTEAAGGFAFCSMTETWRVSHTFLKKVDSLFTTGSTGTNVCDIQITLVV
jgi:glycerate 2-kinase